jgi:hypothetical protein
VRFLGISLQDMKIFKVLFAALLILTATFADVLSYQLISPKNNSEKISERSILSAQIDNHTQQNEEKDDTCYFSTYDYQAVHTVANDISFFKYFALSFRQFIPPIYEVKPSAVFIFAVTLLSYFKIILIHYISPQAP